MSRPLTTIAIVPHPHASVTPCEVLVDFADASPGWTFLDEDTVYYEALKQAPCCVLRHQVPATYYFIDFAFATDAEGTLHCRCLDFGTPPLDEPGDRAHALDAFTAAFERYLATGNRPVTLRLGKAEPEAVPA